MRTQPLHAVTSTGVPAQTQAPHRGALGEHTWRPVGRTQGLSLLQRFLAHKKQTPRLGAPLGPRHSPTVGSEGFAVSYERGAPVHTSKGLTHCRAPPPAKSDRAILE